MRKIIYLSLVLVILGIASCKKEEVNIPTETPVVDSPNYFPLAIGNYWVYDLYKVENHQETLSNKRDSLMITKDTIIREQVFYVLEGDWFPYSDTKIFYRDSLGYIINQKGEIIFTSLLKEEVYYNNTAYYDSLNNDTVFHIEYFTNEELEFIDIPIGQFEAMSRTANYTTFPGNESFPDTLKYRSYDSKFIENIGQATDAIFYASAPFHYEKRLVDYHVNTAEEK